MTPFATLLLTPLLASALLAGVGHRPIGAWINVLVSFVTLAASLLLSWQVREEGSLLAFGGVFFLDSFNIFLVALTSFVATTTSLFSRPYMAHECVRRGLARRHMRFYHAMYQLFIFAMLLALSTNNLGILWIALELATLATVLLVSLYRTPQAIAAGWKYFILCGVGIAMALFGTVLIFFTSSRILGHGNPALTWTLLHENATELDPQVMVLAFLFLVVGYGTKVGLAPMHTWLPPAHGEGPTPISAVLSGLLLNVALYALVRCKMLVDVATGSDVAGTILMGFGLFSVMVATFSLYRQKDVKRLYSYSSVEHMGLITFSFGVGTPLANFAGLLHMTVHSLVKSGIFFTVGHAAQAMGTQRIGGIRGLITHQPGIGWGLLLGTVAISGLPPFGVFASEFMMFTATLQTHPWLVAPLLFFLLVGIGGLFLKVQPMVYGPPPAEAVAVTVSMLPVYVHLGLALVLGVAIPPVLAQWYDHAARLLSGGMQ
ncbi:MAG: hydrogenase 4 subunit F [Magnetococcus sp. WYHC-3]